MQKATTVVDAQRISEITSNSVVVKEDIAAHFLIQEFKDGNVIALHFSREWAYFSKDRQIINETVRKHMLLGRPDYLDDPMIKNAKKILRERKVKIKKFCDYLGISTKVDLSREELSHIDSVIKAKGSKEIYAKYYLELGLFLGEIIAVKTQGEWYLKETSDFWVKYKTIVIKSKNRMEDCPWDRLGRFYEEETGEFSFYSSIIVITEGFGVYQQDFKSN